MALYDKASLVLIPSGTKAGTVFSQKPVPSNDVLTDNLVTNGDFSDGSTGWDLSIGSAVIANGVAEFPDTTNSFVVKPAIVERLVKTYILTYTVKTSNEGNLALGGGSSAFGTVTLPNTVGTHTLTLTSNGISTNLQFFNSSSFVGTIDDISLKQVVDGDFDFTRSTYATRVNSQGLIEKERSNLLLQSNNFDTTWSSSNLNTPTNGFSGYDGSSDAWKIEASSSAFSRINQSSSISGLYTFSVYAKKAEYDYIGLYFNGVAKGVVVSLVDGSVVNSIVNYPDIYADAEDIGSGWYRVSIAHTLTGSGEVSIYPCETTTYNGNTTYNQGVYIQDAQLEQGLVATDYIETTTSAVYTGITDNVPRLDYDGDCPSLLLEPSRTNEIPQSEYLNSSLISRSNDFEINTSDTTSPEGLNNACKFQFPSGSIRYFGDNVGTLNDATASVFVKAGTHQYVQYVSSTTASFAINFDVANGTSNVVGTLPSGATYDIEDYGNDWYRIWVSYDHEGATPTIYWWMANDLNTPRAQVVTSAGDLYFYGFQIEEGSYATSYIPTYGTSVTRNNDSATQNSSYTFGSGAFSLFLEHEPIPVGSGGQVVILRANPLDFYFRWTSDTVLNIWNQEIQQTVLNKAITGGRNQNIKICMVYDGVGSTDVYVNGVKERDGYSFTWPDGPYNIGLDSSVIINGDIPIHISQVMTFETALTNEEAIALTTV